MLKGVARCSVCFTGVKAGSFGLLLLVLTPLLLYHIGLVFLGCLVLLALLLTFL